MAEELQVADYSFPLPKELIAQEPLPERDAARLMVLDRAHGAVSHRQVRDLPELVRPGDLLVLNQSRVLPARLFGVRAATGGKWEGLFLHAPQPGVWALLSQTRGYLKEGETILVSAPGPQTVDELRRSRENDSPAALRLTVLGRTPERHLLVRPASEGPAETLLERFGHVPLPPYIRKGMDGPKDRERYQTVFAQAAGSVAAPTAGLHFTSVLLKRLEAAGVALAFVTLHVGLGTFLPLEPEQLRSGLLHEERWSVPPATARAWAECRQRGGRVIAVGTTSVRTMESAWRGGAVREGAGTTRLFIRPPYAFRSVDGLMTNFHLPESSLLMLVSAFVGRERILAAYAEAVRERYRFFSYGDAMLAM